MALTTLDVNLVARLLMRPSVEWHAFSPWLTPVTLWNTRINHELVSAFLATCPTVDSLHMKLLLLTHYSPSEQLLILSCLKVHYHGARPQIKAA